MTEPAAVALAPRFLAASTRDRHHQHLAALAGTAAWTIKQASFTTTATSTCGHVTLHADRTANNNEAHLFLHAHTRPGAASRWIVTLGGELPVESLASMTTVLTAELLRDPDYILYGLPQDGHPFTLEAPDWDAWQYHDDRDLLEWRTRHHGSKAVAIMRGRESSAPPLAGGENASVMAAATVPGAGRPEVLW
jgi:hypothetical protein